MWYCFNRIMAIYLKSTYTHNTYMTNFKLFAREFIKLMPGFIKFVYKRSIR